jgi:hypothetical protein
MALGPPVGCIEQSLALLVIDLPAAQT